MKDEELRDEKKHCEISDAEENLSTKERLCARIGTKVDVYIGLERIIVPNIERDGSNTCSDVNTNETKR